MNFRLTLWTIFAILSFSVPTIGATDAWYTTQRELTRRLSEENTDITKLATEYLSKKPANGQEAMLKTAVMMRCGMNQQAIEALKELKAIAPDLDGNQVIYAYTDTYGDTPAPNVLKTILELFADSVTSGINMPKEFLNSGWTVKQIDAWLAKMAKRSDYFWTRMRYRLQRENGNSDSFIKKLTEAASRHPEDVDRVLALLDILGTAHCYGILKQEQWGQIAWIPEKVKPKSAMKAQEIASFFKKHYHFPEAIPFYQLAIDIPLTEEEIQDLKHAIVCIAIPVAFTGSLSERQQVNFTLRALENLIDCLALRTVEQKQRLKAVGVAKRRNEIKKNLTKAIELRKKYNMAPNPKQESHMRSLTGQWTIENQDKKKEKKELSKDDPHYWIGRANYYKGQRKPALEEEALRKALLLTPLPTEPDLSPKSKDSENFPRVLRLNNYVVFLKGQKRIEDAIELCRKELQQAPADFRSAQSAADLLALHLEAKIRFDDPVLWNWLANRSQWEWTEGNLICKILARAKNNDEYGKLRSGGHELDKCIVRAEKLAFKKDPTRAYELGSALNQIARPDRAAKLLKYAIENAQNQELKERASQELLRAYLALNDWKHAEEILPEAAKGLTLKWLLEKVSSVAVVAAKTGAKADAMRLWKRAVNLSPCQTDGLQDLVNAGLKSELQKFYGEIREKFPNPEGIDRVLATLEKMTPKKQKS